MCDVGDQLIRESAQRREFITYGELWQGIQSGVEWDIGQAWRKIPNLLGHIADRANVADGLILTALVVDDEDRHPSEGFFRLAVSLDLFSSEDAPESGQASHQLTDVQRSFWELQADALFLELAV